MADFQRKVRCEDEVLGALVGVVAPLDGVQRERLLELGLPAGAEVRRLYVTSQDEKADALLGVVLCFGVAPLAALSIVVGRRRAVMAQVYGRLRAAAQGTERDVRLLGLLMIGAAAFLWFVGDDMALWGVIPVPWFAWLTLGLGVWMLAFPKHYRERLATPPPRRGPGAK